MGVEIAQILVLAIVLPVVSLAFRNAVARRFDVEVLITGRIEGKVQLSCDRCLKPFEHAIGLDLAVRFAPQPESTAPSAADEDGQDGIEIEDEDVDSVNTVGDAVNLILSKLG